MRTKTCIATSLVCSGISADLVVTIREDSLIFCFITAASNHACSPLGCIFKGLRQIQPQLSSAFILFQLVDYIAYRCGEDRIIDEFTGRSFHGEGKLLLIDTELGVDLSCVAPRIYSNPFPEADEVDAVKAVQYELIIDRRVQPQHLVAETGRNTDGPQETRHEMAF